MKIIKHADLARLLDAVKSCKGNVLFTSDQGDRLDLKSALSQFVFIIAEHRDLGGEIICEDGSDYGLLREFLEEA